MVSYPELKGKTVIVTGAASPGSIGEAISRSFAEQGCHVAVADLDFEGAKKLADDIVKGGGDAFPVQVDVTSESSVQSMVKTALDRTGKIDILVNNAGGFQETERVNQITEERWDKIIDLNLKSVFLCTKAVYDLMAEQRSGRIINISSIAGRMPTLPTPVHYVAAKGGMVAYTKFLARELAEFGVTANCVAPGPTATGRFLRLRGASDPSTLTELNEHVPLGRLSIPEDQAKAVLFLASEQASFITGHTIDVNGGIVML